MNYYFFNGDIDEDNFGKLIKAAKDFDLSQELTIYICSNGGDFGLTCSIADFINEYPKDVTLVATRCVNSCAWILFMISNSKKRSNSSAGFIHLLSLSVETRKLISPEEDDVTAKKDLDNDNKRLLEFLESLKIRKNLIGEVEKGRDVYVSVTELAREAKLAEKMFYKPKEG